MTLVIWWLVAQVVAAVRVVWRWLDRGNPENWGGFVRSTLARKLNAVWRKGRAVWEEKGLPRVAHLVARWKESFGPIFVIILRWVEEEADDVRERARRARMRIELWWY